MTPANDKSHPVLARISATLAETDDAGLRAVITLCCGLYVHGNGRLRARKAINATVSDAFQALMPRPAISLEALAADLLAKPQNADLTVWDLKGPSRKRSTHIVRSEFCHLALEAGHSQPAVGRFLGGRDHTSIRFARKSWLAFVAKSRG